MLGMAKVGFSEWPVTKESEVLIRMRPKGLTMGSYLEKRLNWVEKAGCLSTSYANGKRGRELEASVVHSLSIKHDGFISLVLV